MGWRNIWGGWAISEFDGITTSQGYLVNFQLLIYLVQANPTDHFLKLMVYCSKPMIFSMGIIEPLLMNHCRGVNKSISMEALLQENYFIQELFIIFMNQGPNNRKKCNILQGRWSKSEKERFILGYRKYGRDWAEVAKVVKTRNLAQIRSHAQKFFMKMQHNGVDPGSDYENSDQISYQNSSQNQQRESQNIVMAQIKSGVKQLKRKAEQSEKEESKSNQSKQKKRKKSLQTKDSQKPALPCKFPAKQGLMAYIKKQKNPSHFLQCLLLNWEHLQNGGNFLQQSIFDHKFSKA